MSSFGGNNKFIDECNDNTKFYEIHIRTINRRPYSTRN